MAIFYQTAVVIDLETLMNDRILFLQKPIKFASADFYFSFHITRRRLIKINSCLIFAIKNI